MFVAALAWSCQTETVNEANQEAGNEEKLSTEITVAENKFGVEVDAESAISLVALQEQSAGKDSLEDVTITAKVSEVCQMKGCWMTLEKPDGSTMHVKFKDYALFMPKDLAGKEVVLHGKAKVTTTSVDELKHLAQDGGKSEEEIAAITEPKTDLAFMADGVLVK